jgi:hypothetical protein
MMTNESSSLEFRYIIFVNKYYLYTVEHSLNKQILFV